MVPFIKWVFKKFGFEVRRHKDRRQIISWELRPLKDLSTIVAGFPHEDIRPEATYAPWSHDQDFLSLLGQIRTNTFVDRYRLYELWSLVEQTAKLEGDILEVGVWRGGSGCLMASRCKALGLESHLFLCDTFQGVAKSGQDDPIYRNGEHSDTSKDIVLQLAKRLKLSNVRVLQGIFPEETGSQLADRKFRLCHIDVDVFRSAQDVMSWVWPRLVPGGIVIFDDYGFRECEGVTKFANEMLHEYPGLFIYNVNGHGLFVKPY